MTTTSGSVGSSYRSTAVATTLLEVPEATVERLGVDDPLSAHGGHPRRAPGPPIPGGLVTRVRAPVALPTRVRRIPTSLY
jgi:hypothetical protein